MSNTLKISKWGNGQGIRLPKTILNILNIREGDELEVKVEENKIVLNPVDKNNFTFAELFEGYKGNTKQKEYWDDDEPVGKEIF